MSNILPMSLLEKLWWFYLEPIYVKIFPPSPEEIEKSKQEIQNAKQRLKEMGFHFYESETNERFKK